MPVAHQEVPTSTKVRVVVVVSVFVVVVVGDATGPTVVYSVCFFGAFFHFQA